LGLFNRTGEYLPIHRGVGSEEMVAINQLAERQREPGQRVVYVKIKGLKPAKSRLLNPELAVHRNI